MKKKTTPRITKIDIRPKWREVIPVLLHIVTKGTAEGKQEARDAFQELATMLDALNEQHPGISLTISGNFKYIK